MKKSIVFMFSGQGSQYYQMGRELFSNNTVFKKWMLELDYIAKSIMGESVIKEIFHMNKGKADVFNQIKFTHPALFIIQYALAQTLIEDGIRPSHVVGTSLGEFVAAAVAKVITVKEGLEGVICHAKLAEQYCAKGGMTAVMDEKTLYFHIPVIRENSELASVNYHKHFVITGEEDKLKKIHKYLKTKEIMYQELPVTYGFHSYLMDPIEEEYKKVVSKIKYRKPSIAFISSIYGTSMEKISKDYLWEVTRKPINFPKALALIEKQGKCVYIDLGPSGTLANFVKQNMDDQMEREIFATLNPFGQDSMNYKKIIETLNNNVEVEKEEKGMFAYVFSGQGSQKKGMGAELFDEFPELTASADKILGYSIKELCTEDKKNQLNKTAFTQPALYVVNGLSYLKKLKETGKTPDYVAGHSLGEYSALFAAGAFDFETGLKLVKKRGELMGKVINGTMAAVVGLDEDRIKKILNENNFHSIDIANYNTPTQIVLSGPKESIKNAKEVFENEGASLYAILNVSGAFHSRYMDDAKDAFSEFLEDISFKEMHIPVISNVVARPYKKDHIKNYLCDQITHSVKWTESIRYLMGKKVENIEQVGPGTILTGLVSTIINEAQPLIVEAEEDEQEIVEEQEDKEQEDKEQEEKEQEDKVQENDEILEVLFEEKNTYEVNEGSGAVLEEKNTSNKKEKSYSITASSLGDAQFKKENNLKYAYLSGSMYKGISSKEMVVKMGKAGLMGFYGAGGVSTEEIEEAIKYIQGALNEGQSYGMNLLYNPIEVNKEDEIVDLYLRYGIKNIEASAYMSVNSALVRYRLKGLKKDKAGRIYSENKIIAKISRPEVAEVFLSPAPDKIVNKLLNENKITATEAELSRKIAMVDAICIEADSGGHTDQGVAYALMPAIIKLRDEMVSKFNYERKINIGAAGGIGTPEAAAAAFILGADFIVTGSINQCTVEARTSEAVKDLLQQANVQDTVYAPAGDMFELGAKVQVLKKGLFFPARANKLYELYRQYDSLDEIDEKTKDQIQERYFKKNFEEIFEEAKDFYSKEEMIKAELNPKQKMAMIFKWYFGHSTKLALRGSHEQKVDYQIHCGPALGAFNQWVKGTELENWQDRNVDIIGEKIMEGTAELLNKRFYALTI
ncbi:MAG: [acyl-carrier-protein] S-malonyltransferase [Firmicutes bacterium HGW-Firmicutes-7]|nr:MAG: [acyl-carrier-protein] S-malonyltransferase [Firmicutes bacterium HGW-Firmicutes-7]